MILNTTYMLEDLKYTPSTQTSPLRSRLLQVSFYFETYLPWWQIGISNITCPNTELLIITSKLTLPHFSVYNPLCHYCVSKINPGPSSTATTLLKITILSCLNCYNFALNWSWFLPCLPSNPFITDSKHFNGFLLHFKQSASRATLGLVYYYVDLF